MSPIKQPPRTGPCTNGYKCRCKGYRLGNRGTTFDTCANCPHSEQTHDQDILDQGGGQLTVMIDTRGAM